jgi:hypothetical protein
MLEFVGMGTQLVLEGLELEVVLGFAGADVDAAGQVYTEVGCWRLVEMEVGHLVGTWMCNLTCGSFHQGTSSRNMWRPTSTIERKRSSSSCQAIQRARSKQRLEAHS